MQRILIAYPAILVAFVALDAIWLSTMSNVLYRPVLKDMLAAEVRLIPAIVFYLLYPAGLLIFATLPGLRDGEWTTTLIYGALFGFFAYATYDLTNQATLKNWSTTLTVADLAWGSFLSAFASSVGFFVTRYFVR